MTRMSVRAGARSIRMKIKRGPRRGAIRTKRPMVVKTVEPVAEASPVAPTPLNVKRPKATAVMVTMAEIQNAVLSLPFVEGVFRIIPCSRKEATRIQHWIYDLNKNHVRGEIRATRYNVAMGHLMVWRME